MKNVTFHLNMQTQERSPLISGGFLATYATSHCRENPCEKNWDVTYIAITADTLQANIFTRSHICVRTNKCLYLWDSHILKLCEIFIGKKVHNDRTWFGTENDTSYFSPLMDRVFLINVCLLRAYRWYLDWLYAIVESCERWFCCSTISNLITFLSHVFVFYGVKMFM